MGGVVHFGLALGRQALLTQRAALNRTGWGQRLSVVSDNIFVGVPGIPTRKSNVSKTPSDAQFLQLGALLGFLLSLPESSKARMFHCTLTPTVQQCPEGSSVLPALVLLASTQVGSSPVSSVPVLLPPFAGPASQAWNLEHPFGCLHCTRQTSSCSHSEPRHSPRCQVTTPHVVWLYHFYSPSTCSRPGARPTKHRGALL